MPPFISPHEAKTRISGLVDRAAGEEGVIAKNGVPRAGTPRQPANALRIAYIAPDFDAPDPEIKRLFEGARESR